MAKQTFFSRQISKIIKKFLSVEQVKSLDVGKPRKIIVIRQHNQFGDLLASVSLFRAIKETFPEARLTVVVSPDNYYAITKNKYIDEYFIFNKKKLPNPFYLIKTIRLLRRKYDLAIMPATVAISYTSSLLTRISKAKVRIGPSSLDGAKNDFDYFFDRRVELNWKKHPDSHVSDFGLEIVRPFGINTKDYSSHIEFGEEEFSQVKQYFEEHGIDESAVIIGVHPGAGKPRNRWSLLKFAKLIEELYKEYTPEFIVTGSKSDANEIKFLKENANAPLNFFIDREIPTLAALISKCDLFITNDTGVMHVAGATDVPQISIFGPTNPFNWAPIGLNKYFIRKSDLIDDVTVDDVLKLSKLLLKTNKKLTHEKI